MANLLAITHPSSIQSILHVIWWFALGWWPRISPKSSILLFQKVQSYYSKKFNPIIFSPLAFSLWWILVGGDLRQSVKLPHTLQSCHCCFCMACLTMQKWKQMIREQFYCITIWITSSTLVRSMPLGLWQPWSMVCMAMQIRKILLTRSASSYWWGTDHVTTNDTCLQSDFTPGAIRMEKSLLMVLQAASQAIVAMFHFWHITISCKGTTLNWSFVFAKCYGYLAKDYSDEEDALPKTPPGELINITAISVDRTPESASNQAEETLTWADGPLRWEAQKM